MATIGKRADKVKVISGKRYTLDREYTAKFPFLAENRAKDLRKKGWLVRVVSYDKGKYKATYKRRA